MTVHKIEHTGIKVSSLEASIDFYTEVIGLRLRHIIGEPGEMLRLAFLAFPGQADVEVELLESNWADLPREGKVSHLAFSVSGIEDEHKRIANLGLEGLSPIRHLAGGSRFFFFNGLDGERLEFFES
ncbi:VOC family protein [Paenibacillus sp. sgz500958]|uniref:VOC family protein n=1 Tax=Paenibacillus sp. sgz500958 TaxID=3242475 RepID=UPI0036D30F79